MWQMLRGEGLRGLGAWNGAKNTQGCLCPLEREHGDQSQLRKPLQMSRESSGRVLGAAVRGGFQEHPGCSCPGRVPPESWAGGVRAHGEGADLWGQTAQVPVLLAALV